MATERHAGEPTGFQLACDAPSCDICNLGPLPGESRDDWKARLKARFACEPLPEVEHHAPGLWRRTIPCKKCGGMKSLINGCPNCRKPRRAT